MRGHVIRWIDGRGFGFVRAEDGPPRDFFVHASVIVGDEPYKSLVEGEPVEFELKPGTNGKLPMVAFVVRLNQKAGA